MEPAGPLSGLAPARNNDSLMEKRKTPMAAASQTSHSLKILRAEAAACRACPLWKDATQTVFGEGPQQACLMLVGEQPGDKEDLAGRPFAKALEYQRFVDDLRIAADILRKSARAA